MVQKKKCVFFSKKSKKVDVFFGWLFVGMWPAIFWGSGEYTRYGRMNLRGHVVCHFSWVPLDMPTFRTSLLIFCSLGVFFETRIRSKQKKGDHSWTQRRGSRLKIYRSFSSNGWNWRAWRSRTRKSKRFSILLPQTAETGHDILESRKGVQQPLQGSRSAAELNDKKAFWGNLTPPRKAWMNN